MILPCVSLIDQFAIFSEGYKTPLSNIFVLKLATSVSFGPSIGNLIFAATPFLS